MNSEKQNISKPKKKNKLLPLVICVLALAALAVGYALINSANAKKAAEEAAAAEAADQTVVLAEQKSSNVKTIAYTYENETINLEYKNDYWYNADDNYFPLNQTQPAAMAEALASITANRLVEDNGSDANFASYGLTEPYATVSVTYADGTSLGMVFGDLNGFTGSRYMNLAGTTKVYMLATTLLDSFKYTHNDLINHDTVDSIDFSTLTELDVAFKDDNGEDGLERYYLDNTTDEDGNAVSTWYFSNGTDEPAAVDSSVIQTLFSTVLSVKFTNCAAYNVRDDETFCEYGLGSAAATTITLKYTVTMEVTDESSSISSTAAKTADKEFAISFSATTEDGSMYVNKAGSKLIYLLTPSTAA